MEQNETENPKRMNIKASIYQKRKQEGQSDRTTVGIITEIRQQWNSDQRTIDKDGIACRLMEIVKNKIRV